jgi:hypothetical protein
LLKAQITTEIYWFSLLVTGIFPAKSTCTRQNIFVVTGIGITVVEIQGSIQHIILWARTIHSLVFIWTDFFQNTVFACLQIGLFFTFCLFFPAPGFFKKSSYRKIPALEKSEKHVFSLSPLYIACFCQWRVSWWPKKTRFSRLHYGFLCIILLRLAPLQNPYGFR